MCENENPDFESGSVLLRLQAGESAREEKAAPGSAF